MALPPRTRQRRWWWCKKIKVRCSARYRQLIDLSAPAVLWVNTGQHRRIETGPRGIRRPRYCLTDLESKHSVAGIFYGYLTRVGRRNVVRDGIDDDLRGIRRAWRQRREVRIGDVFAYAITLPQWPVQGFRISQIHREIHSVVRRRDNRLWVRQSIGSSNGDDQSFTGLILKTYGVIYGECVAVCVQLAMNKVHEGIKPLLLFHGSCSGNCTAGCCKISFQV